MTKAPPNPDSVSVFATIKIMDNTPITPNSLGARKRDNTIVVINHNNCPPNLLIKFHIYALTLFIYLEIVKNNLLHFRSVIKRQEVAPDILIRKQSFFH